MTWEEGDMVPQRENSAATMRRARVDDAALKIACSDVGSAIFNDVVTAIDGPRGPVFVKGVYDIAEALIAEGERRAKGG